MSGRKLALAFVAAPAPDPLAAVVPRDTPPAWRGERRIAPRPQAGLEATQVRINRLAFGADGGAERIRLDRQCLAAPPSTPSMTTLNGLRLRRRPPPGRSAPGAWRSAQGCRAAGLRLHGRRPWRLSRPSHRRGDRRRQRAYGPGVTNPAWTMRAASSNSVASRMSTWPGAGLSPRIGTGRTGGTAPSRCSRWWPGALRHTGDRGATDDRPLAAAASLIQPASTPPPSPPSAAISRRVGCSSAMVLLGGNERRRRRSHAACGRRAAGSGRATSSCAGGPTQLGFWMMSICANEGHNCAACATSPHRPHPTQSLLTWAIGSVRSGSSLGLRVSEGHPTGACRNDRRCTRPGRPRNGCAPRARRPHRLRHRRDERVAGAPAGTRRRQ